ncbi:hypothetical protein [Bdellovibrio svalbardensis]|uniref:Cytochrome c domain-containing protein n=1 Tax=Bdellovibrio svalbardensis TaxID=2972972 RepID=A0ABT6DJM6_9BACT|nr:hypothetical protein [Bdellovibrio svalbardensis]MDG0816124.1 hypothetical protein [Bdellovibrio svalbardensis]
MMNKKNQYKIIGLTSGTLVLLLCFQNCSTGLGEGFAISSSSTEARLETPSSGTGSTTPTDTSSGNESTGDICEDQIYAKFGSGYYVFLRKNCAGCHNGEHEAPAFASANQYMSYQIFKDKGYIAISNNAVNQNHNYPATGPQNNGAISSLKAEWETALTDWASCKGTDTVDKSVVTSYITNPAIIANKDNAAIWSKLTWNFTSTMPAKSTTYPLELSLEAQVAKVGGNTVGYAIRNPNIKLTSGTAKYRVKGLFFYLNDKMIDAATTYRNINAVVCPNTPLNLAPVGNAQLLVQAMQKNTDKFAVQFTSIEKVDASTTCGTGSTDVVVVDTTPATVSFAQLVSSDAKLGVFKNQCFSCHTGSSARAGLDLSDYAQSKAKAAKILTRINDSSNPMPTSGMMSSSMRSIVEKWVSTGTPQ